MNLKQLKALVSKGESATVEFKKSTGQLRPAFESLCAFLNGQGGTVLIGINDGGQIIGQDVNDKTCQEIANEVNKFEPNPSVDIQYTAVKERKKIIVIHANAGTHPPYIYDGRAFQRNETTTMRMSQHRYEQMLVARGQLNHSWEESIVKDCQVNDLDTDLILRVVRLAVQEQRLSESVMRAEPREILEKFNLLRNNKLTRAAVILFCANEEKQFIQSQLRLARFKGLDKQEFIDRKLVTGNAFQLYDQAISFLSNYLPIGAKIPIDVPFRIDTPAIPYKVLREAIVNALCHRDYHIRGGAVSLAIYDNRIEISSTGALLAGLTPKDLSGEHRSILRNPLIAKVFYACGFVEMWGRGTQEIMDLCKVAGNPEPIFLTTKVDFTVCLPLREPIASTIIHPKYGKGLLNPRQEEILRLLSGENVLSANDIFAKLANPPSLRTVKADLSSLQKLMLVEQEGKGRKAAWKIKS